MFLCSYYVLHYLLRNDPNRFSSTSGKIRKRTKRRILWTKTIAIASTVKRKGRLYLPPLYLHPPPIVRIITALPLLLIPNATRNVATRWKENQPLLPSSSWEAIIIVIITIVAIIAITTITVVALLQKTMIEMGIAVLVVARIVMTADNLPYLDLYLSG